MKTKNHQNEVAGSITVREAGARGGRSTLERRGSEFFQEIGRKGAQRQKELYRQLLSEFGRKGGRPRRPNLNETPGEGHSQTKEESGRPECSSPS